MKLRDWFFKQLVEEDELDSSFQWAEDADHAMMADLGAVGIVSGMVATPRLNSSNLSVDVSAGSAYTKIGQRLAFPATLNVPLVADENGVATAVSAAGMKKVVSIFVQFTRSLSEVRTDGNAQPVYTVADEGVSFVVRQSVESASPTPVALDVESILLADITRTYGQQAIEQADISYARTEDAIRADGATYGLRRGRVRDAVKDIVGWLNGLYASTTAASAASNAAITAHVNKATGAHAATAISYAGSGQWADGSNVGSADVEGAIDEVVSDLRTGGAGKIGATARAATALFATTAATVQGLLDEISAYLDVGPRGRKTVKVTASFLLSDTYRRVVADSTLGSFVITLPAASSVPAGTEWEVKDGAGKFLENPCVLRPTGGDLIEGANADYSMAVSRGSWRVFSDGTAWLISIAGTNGPGIRTVTGSTTIGATDETVIFNPTALATVTLPAASTMKGRRVWIINGDGSTKTYRGALASTSTVNGGDASKYPLDMPFGAWLCTSDGTGWHVRNMGP